MSKLELRWARRDDPEGYRVDRLMWGGHELGDVRCTLEPKPGSTGEYAAGLWVGRYAEVGRYASREAARRALRSHVLEQMRAAL